MPASSIFTLALAAFAVVPSALAYTSHAETNAQRFARGLTPAPPSNFAKRVIGTSAEARWLPSRTRAKRQGASAVPAPAGPVAGETGTLVALGADGSALGPVSNALNGFGDVFAGAGATAIAVGLETGGTFNGENLFDVFSNDIGGYIVAANLNQALDNANRAFLAAGNAVDPGPAGYMAGNSDGGSDAGNLDYQESAIFAIDPTTGLVTPIFTQPDNTQVQGIFCQNSSDDGTGTIVASLYLILDACLAGEPQVNIFFVPS